MSQMLIQQYLNDLADLKRVSGTDRETVVREAFKTLLKGWGKARQLIFVPEYEHQSPSKERRYIDGALLHELRIPFGYWEAKDEKDDLDAEIAFKFRRGYPQDNIIFEDTREAVLIQGGRQARRCPVDDVEALSALLTQFFAFARPEIADFRKAVVQFKTDLPSVLAALREMIAQADQDKPDFRAAKVAFLDHARETINPNVTDADVREMLIQHILTEEIFSQVFDNSDFHSKNNVAKELYALEATFFTGGVKRKTLEGLKPYYAAIRSSAALVSSHIEKQKFLKIIYENFYKVYNPKAADRLGVVYTPNEIVRFMIESTDWLCQQHFGKKLIDKNVEILDPAAGTGTFIVELLEHFRGQPAKLKHKYKEELHANEVAILPYYVANLNIEATYAALTGEYEEFENLCFVDTLDNVAALKGAGQGHYGDLLGGVSEENVKRIKRQNKKKISVIIGNPPYNANQLNENENNKNREYPEIDQRIKETYIAESTAQKTKLYDMYARFFRWASDRVDENGIVAFVTNRSFIESRTFDGFRKLVAEEFNDIYVMDLGGDVRADPRLSGTKHNVFGIQTGVAISFMVKRAKAKGSRIRYARRPQMETAEEKLSFLQHTKLDAVVLEDVTPEKNGTWINQVENDFNDFIPIANGATKSLTAEENGKEHTIFKLYSLGVSTNRDEWLYDFDQAALKTKVKRMIAEYNSAAASTIELSVSIKWSETLKRRKKASYKELFSKNRIRKAAYRPFTVAWLYQSELFIDRPGCSNQIFPIERTVENACITFTDPTGMKPWLVSAVSRLPDLHYVGAAAGTVCLPLARFDTEGQRIDNITDWALDQFRTHYEGETAPGSAGVPPAHAPKARLKKKDAGGTPALPGKARPIIKDAIFHYVYGVLHDPVYREKYAQNLKREFPRIPFYPDFWRWAEWGEKLMALHIGYETVAPWPLERIDTPDERSRHAGLAPKALLKADPDAGVIHLDTETQLTGIPPEAWTYKLGNRSALGWILDQYKEKTPKDPTIREKFNTYRFADHKETVIDLLRRVTRVSVETVAITQAMGDAER